MNTNTYKYILDRKIGFAVSQCIHVCIFEREQVICVYVVGCVYAYFTSCLKIMHERMAMKIVHQRLPSNTKQDRKQLAAIARRDDVKTRMTAPMGQVCSSPISYYFIILTTDCTRIQKINIG